MIGRTFLMLFRPWDVRFGFLGFFFTITDVLSNAWPHRQIVYLKTWVPKQHVPLISAPRVLKQDQTLECYRTLLVRCYLRIKTTTKTKQNKENKVRKKKKKNGDGGERGCLIVTVFKSWRLAWTGQ